MEAFSFYKEGFEFAYRIQTIVYKPDFEEKQEMKQVIFVGFKRRCLLDLGKILLLPYYVVKTILCIAASPFVMFYDLFDSTGSLDKRWALYLLILSILPIVASWYLWDDYQAKTDEIFSVVSTYAKMSNTKYRVKDVPYKELINLYAFQHDLDPAFIAAVIEEESGFNPEAVSPAGARGLMQITPRTWRYIVEHSTCDGEHLPPACGPDCIFDPEANIRAGTDYLGRLLKDFNGNTVTVLAAYNAGRGNIQKYGIKKRGLVPNFPETQSYIRDVLAIWIKTREPFPPMEISGLKNYYDLNKKLYTTSFMLWSLLGMWIFLKAQKKTIHTFKFYA
jgi:soluble lytic murein transglycosylase